MNIPVDQLPNEILLQICDYSTYLNNCLKHIYMFSMTCKVFYDIAIMHPLWKTLKYTSQIRKCHKKYIESVMDIFSIQIEILYFNEFKNNIMRELKRFPFVHSPQIVHNRIFNIVSIYFGNYKSITDINDIYITRKSLYNY